MLSFFKSTLVILELCCAGDHGAEEPLLQTTKASLHDNAELDRAERAMNTSKRHRCAIRIFTLDMTEHTHQRWESSCIDALCRGVR